jgi:adenosylcobinamide-GDP ribazoletransferase
MIRAFVTAFRTLTIIPVPGKDTDEMANSLFFFPLVGAFLGGIFLGIHILCSLFLREAGLLNAVILLFIPTFLTGGLHIDGLADVADSFGGGRDKERRLKILKDSRLGTFGVIAIFFILLFKFILIEYCFRKGIYFLIPCSFIFSRSALGIFLLSFPYIRDKSGMASPFTGKRYYIIFLIIIFAVCFFLCSFLLDIRWLGISTFTSVLFIFSFGFVCKRLFGGITGDCIGTANEIFEVGFVLCHVILFSIPAI